MIHTFKISNLSPYEMRERKRNLGFFVRHGIKITFLKRVIYVHMDTDHPYSVLLNMLTAYKRRGMVTCNEKSLKWFNIYRY